MIISPCVLLVPAAADKESMSHPHKHKLTQHIHAHTFTHTHTHTERCLLKKYSMLFACFDNRNTLRQQEKKVDFPAALYFMEILTLLPRSSGGNM